MGSFWCGPASAWRRRMEVRGLSVQTVGKALGESGRPRGEARTDPEEAHPGGGV